MAWSVVAHAGAIKTTSAINTVGSGILIGGISDTYTGSSISDSMSNSWTLISGWTAGDGSGIGLRWYYCKSPKVSSSHTFSTTTTAGAVFILALFGNETVSPLDQHTSYIPTTDGTSIAPTSITPAQNDEIVVNFTQLGLAASSISIDSSFVVTDTVNAVSGTNYGGLMAYLIQTTAAAENPTISWTGTAERISSIASFKSSSLVYISPSRSKILVPRTILQHRG